MEYDRIRVPTPFAVGRVNCYVLRGDGLTLIDPGPASEESYETVVEGLAAGGHAVEDVDRIVVTHPHMDHFGGVARLVAESGAEVCAHGDAVGWLADPDGQFEREQALFEPFLISMGLPERLGDTVISLPETYREFREPVTVDRELADGDRIAVDDTELEAIHTPGHAPGSVCLLAPGEAVYTGDHVLGHISPNPLLTTKPGTDEERTRSLPTYLDSLERVRGLDAPVAEPGHGDPVGDVDGRIDEIVTHHREREETVAGILEEGPMTAYEVMEELFPDLPATEAFPGMSETIGHLDLLEDEGRVTLNERGDGVVEYALAG
jgi:glyoxylase-like metal-dependent hydrolase (beta-lactamase superfamily II)